MSALLLTADKIRRFDILIDGVVKTTSQSPEGYVVLEFENGKSLVATKTDKFLVQR